MLCGNTGNSITLTMEFLKNDMYDPQLGDSVICLLPDGKDKVERTVVFINECTNTQACSVPCSKKKIAVRFPSGAVVYSMCSVCYELKTDPDDVPTKILRDAL